jgi:hypothetical protein
MTRTVPVIRVIRGYGSLFSPGSGAPFLVSWYRTRGLRKGFIDSQDAAAHALPIQGVDCILEFPFLIQNDKAEAARLTGRSISDDLGRLDLKSLGLDPLLKLHVR